MIDYPKISIWITSCGRIELLIPTIETFIEKSTYPNYEFLIIENQMTPESLKFFDPSKIHAKETEKYLTSLQEKFPDVEFKIRIQPHKRLGEIYNELLADSADYYVNLEDDSETICDPHDHIVDAIRLLKGDPKLLGLRVDIRDDTVYEGSPRFDGTKEIDGMKYVYWSTCSGGAQVMDTAKVRALGGFCDDHPLELYIQTEIQQQRAMREAGMYTGVNLKYYGWWIHIGQHSIQGDGRVNNYHMYTSLLRKGWFDRGENRQPLIPLRGRSTVQER